MRAAAAAVGIMLAASGAGCGGRAAPGKRAEPSCKDVAVRGERWLALEPEAARADGLRWLAEVIDLCQRPGLAVRARTCLVGAPSLAGARACPSLPEVGTDVVDPARAPAPTCDDVLAHVMKLVEEASDPPMTAEDRLDEERAQISNCLASTPEARRCVLEVTDPTDVEDCYIEHEPDDDESEEDIDDLLDLP